MININLIAERRAHKIREMTILRWSGIGVFLVLLVMAALNFMEWTQVNAEQVSINVDRVKFEQRKQLHAELQKTMAKIKDDEPMVALLERVRLSEGAWMIILADLSRATPSDVVIEGVSSNPTNDGVVLRITGKAVDEKTVGSFLLAISQQAEWAKLPQPGSISAQENQKTGQREVHFDVSVPVRGLLGGEL